MSTLAEPMGLDARVAAAARGDRQAYERLVHSQVALGIEVHARESRLRQLSNRARHTAGQDVIGGLVPLEHEPHGLDVFAGVSPVAPRA